MLNVLPSKEPFHTCDSMYSLFLAMETQNWESDVTISAVLSVFGCLLFQICFHPVCLQILHIKIILWELTDTGRPEKESKLRMTEGADKRQSAGESKAWGIRSDLSGMCLISMCLQACSRARAGKFSEQVHLDSLHCFSHAGRKGEKNIA